MKEKKVYLPFAPGIPFHLKYGKYILPKINPEALSYAFDGREATIVSYGGFLECVISLSIIEALAQKFHKTRYKFICDSRFQSIFNLQGIATGSKFDISDETLSKYTAPLFFSKDQNVFLNSLFNYLNVNDYLGNYKYTDKKAVGLQIFKNSFTSWDKIYRPSLNVKCSEELSKSAKIRNFNLNNKYILLFPDRTGLSNHSTSCLNWSLQDVRAFSAMCSKSDYKLIIMTPTPEKYYGLSSFIAPFNVENILYLLSNASFVLSKDADFLISSLLLNKAKLISLKTFDELKIEKNKKYFNSDNDILSIDELTPFKAYKAIQN